MACPIRDFIDYDPNTGEFRWKVRDGQDRFTKMFNSQFAGKVAGGLSSTGYIHIRIKDRVYLAHRLAWFYAHGEWPKSQIDHINGHRDDNRIANLREATVAQNSQNLSKYKTNTSGYPGVSPKRNRWVARVSKDGRKFNLGGFETAADAYAAYLRKKAEIHTFNPTVRSREVA